MARLSSRDRAVLPDSAFAYIDSRGRRRLPINDEAHVRNALARFNQVTFENEAARERARKKLLNAAKKYGIVPVGFIDGQLQSERRKTEQLRRDLKEAQVIQAGLLPDQPPEVPGFNITGICLPSRTVGGDWFDYLPLPDGRLAIILADVSGKGMGAALLMTSTRSILRLVAREESSPGTVLSEANRVLVDDLPPSKFVTMIYAVLDPTRRTVTFANAGHHPPVLADANGVHTLKMQPELPLGLRAGSYTERKIELSVGCRLFLYSDGVIEARNPSSEEYGELRLLDYAGTMPASARLLLQDVLSFTRDQPIVDDITIVTVEALT